MYIYFNCYIPNWDANICLLQMCYTNAYVTTFGTIKYEMGCKDSQVINMIALLQTLEHVISVS